ncbi:MAG: hypothetical protein FJ279_31775 [Planctomycetes bacterium]|nr:hypothetical protein [Planctomycetota bacterium]
MAHYRQGWSRGWKKSLRGSRGEWFDSYWELQYMDELERDPLVTQWTRHHGFRIPYRKWWGGRGYYEPDFLVELVDGNRELREVEGEQLFRDANTTRKLLAGDGFCRERGMAFRVVTKSAVDPATWSPVGRVTVEDGAPSAKPILGEDAHQRKPAGCLPMAVAVASLAAVGVLLTWLATWSRSSTPW